MKLIIGLGNPGKQYVHTRHNAGFLAIDYFLRGKDVIACQSKFQAEICELHYVGSSPLEGELEGVEKVIEAKRAAPIKTFFVKPQTFMNLSGAPVKQLVDFYKLDFTSDILVLHDEVDLPLGKIKLTESSSAAGHNGVQNIIDKFGSKDMHRIRIGVESREHRSDIPTDSFVLHPFSHHEQERLESEVFPKVSEHIKNFIQK